MAWTSKLPLFACACILVLSACVIYDLNGSSLDFSDSQFVLIVTDSMDGDVTEYDVDSYPADTVAIIHHVLSHEVRYIKVGDVVAYHSGGMLITHRVIAIDTAKSLFVLKGDNAASSETVSFEDVEGVVAGTNHVFGAVFSFVRSNALAMVCFIGIILAGVTAFKYYKTVPKEKIQGLRRGTAFAVAMVAVLGIAFAGVGYAYTSATENSGNTISSEYSVISQSTYTFSTNTNFIYYSVTNNGAYSVQVGTGAQTGLIKEDADCFLSLHENTKSTVVITGGVNAGVYTIVLDDGLELVNTPSSPAGVTQGEDTGPLNFKATGLEYGGVAFDNTTIGNSITVTYNELSNTYTVKGWLKHQVNLNGDAMAKLGMPAEDHYGVSFQVKYEKPMTRYFIIDATQLFNGYYGKQIGDTNTLKLTNVGQIDDIDDEKKITITSDSGFGDLTGGWRYILKVINKNTSEVQYAMSSGGDWIYYSYEGNRWLEKSSLILTGIEAGYDTELYLAGPDANIDSDTLHYASGTTEPIYIGNEADRTTKQLVKDGTITFTYDSTVD